MIEERLKHLEANEQFRAEMQELKDRRAAVIERQRAAFERSVVSRKALEERYRAALAEIAARHKRQRLHQQDLGERALSKVASDAKIAELKLQLSK